MKGRILPEIGRYLSACQIACDAPASDFCCPDA
ncbi:hypothetical protein CO2235_90128 [Cupriavidus oxalaticus]|uniref:Uncharacterized protein n=1 Tax=Cupriavidus oxalaticus TaxID=96344 RepID=A0A375GEZ7_9BURK|nr:hypothetical protein CO2235_90128 [Cupriavidus oxalaticus]